MTTYTDVTLSYCLADGNTLNVLGGAEEATVVRQGGASREEETLVSGRGAHLRVEIPQGTPTTPPQVFHPVPAAPSGGSGGLLKVLVIVLALGLFVLLALAAGGFWIYSRGTTEVAANVNTNTNKDIKTPTPSATPVNETDELRDQIANLEKLLNEQKKNDKGANIPLTLPNQPTTTTQARVNSPGDGFLALRTFPNSDAGDRILQIPHGATVSIGACLNTTRIGNRSGRWCRASYNGYSGWVFDGWLNY